MDSREFAVDKFKRQLRKSMFLKKYGKRFSIDSMISKITNLIHYVFCNTISQWNLIHILKVVKGNCILILKCY